MAKISKGNASREVLIKYLLEGICKITFVKKDGTVRNAYSTLNQTLIPLKYEKSVGKIFMPDANVEIMPFWDVVENKWKSFYISKLELLITADELSQEKDLPEALKKKEKKAGQIVNEMDESLQDKIDTTQRKQNRRIDRTEEEKTVDPVNRQNISSVNSPKQTRSNITKLLEERKERLDNAKNIINKLRREAEERRKK